MTNVNVSNIPTILTTLIEERKQWETTELSASNQRLYSILTKCYSLFRDVKGNKKAKRTIEDLMDARGIRVQANSSQAGNIIKLVFGAERRRASAYSIVLRSADKQDIEPGHLAGWISDQGGVEEVRMAQSNPSGETPAQKRLISQRAGEDAAEELQAMATLPKVATTPEGTEFVVLLGRLNSDGSVDVLDFVPDVGGSFAKSALERIGKSTLKANGEESQPSSDADALGTAIESAVAEHLSNQSATDATGAVA